MFNFVFRLSLVEKLDKLFDLVCSAVTHERTVRIAISLLTPDQALLDLRLQLLCRFRDQVLFGSFVVGLFVLSVR